MSDKPVGVISQADEAVLDMVDHGGESAAACTKAHWNCSRTRFRLGTEYVSRTPLRAARYLRHPFSHTNQPKHLRLYLHNYRPINGPGRTPKGKVKANVDPRLLAYGQAVMVFASA